ncbi:MAG: GHKL domain-containing protein [Lachnoclostridium sp.]
MLSFPTKSKALSACAMMNGIALIRFLHFWIIGEIEQLKEYLKEYATFRAEERTVMCTNLTIDAILQFYKHLCDQTEIKFITEIYIPSRIPISDIDLSSLFSNLIENAYEACIDQEPDNPYIYIIARYREATLLLRIKNNISRKPIPLQERTF